ncbi:MAG: HAD hydrolase-like protein [bacterium]|nr:HAD hydrolase-like protein [bacterium]
MIKAVIFDAGNVIVGFDLLRICRALTRYSHLESNEIFYKIFMNDCMEQYEKGHIETHAFYEAVKKSISASSYFTFDLFCSIWQDIFTPNPIIEAVLTRLRPELNLVILSNANELHWDYVAKLSALRDFFSDEERIVLSFRHGFKKPEIELFEEAIKRCGCLVDEILYIDDIAEYIEAFKALGGNGIVYNCQVNTYESLIYDLSMYGVILKE